MEKDRNVKFCISVLLRAGRSTSVSLMRCGLDYSHHVVICTVDPSGKASATWVLLLHSARCILHVEPQVPLHDFWWPRPVTTLLITDIKHSYAVTVSSRKQHKLN